MTEVSRGRRIWGTLGAFGVLALTLGVARPSAAQTIDQRLSASRSSFGGI